MLELGRESIGGIYLTQEEVAPQELNDELFYHAGDLTAPAQPDSGIDKHHGSGPKPGNKMDEDADKENREEDAPMNSKGDEVNEYDIISDIDLEHQKEIIWNATGNRTRRRLWGSKYDLGVHDTVVICFTQNLRLEQTLYLIQAYQRRSAQTLRRMEKN